MAKKVNSPTRSEMADENGIPGDNPVKDDVKHMVVIGTPGSGKPTMLRGSMLQSYDGQIPFIESESVKAETGVPKVSKIVRWTNIVIEFELVKTERGILKVSRDDPAPDCPDMTGM
ncbi:hypothetical protein ACFL1X_01495 [Candidatus Hydrogenedentota bacterium]